MHKILTSCVILFALISHSYIVSAQNSDADKINVVVGGSFAKPKILPGLSKFGIAQITVNYKLNTTFSTIGREKSTGQMAGAKITAYLETTDGELTPADFQEVTDYFYSYFQKKLKQSGIDTVAWSAIIAHDFYKEAAEKMATNEQEKKNEQVWVTANANNGNIMYNGVMAFAFGKIKKAANMSESVGAPIGFFHLTVDFADVMLAVDIKTTEPSYPSGYFPYTKTTSFKYNAATKPDMKVVPNAMGYSLLWNEKSQSESIALSKEIESGMDYHTSITQDPSRIKSGAFAFAKSMDPVVIETTRAQYKAAAKKALEKYADAFIAKSQQLKK